MGVVFIYAGYGKLFGGAPGMQAFTGMVGGLGFPAAGLFAYLAALSEFVGGIAVLLGVFTEIASALIAITMLVALVLVTKFGLPTSDAPIALLAMAVALFCMGAGKYSIAGAMSKDGGKK